MQLTKKKFRQKWPKDEWLQRVNPGLGLKSFGAGNRQYVLVTTGNLKKWVSVKYYGYEDKE